MKKYSHLKTHHLKQQLNLSLNKNFKEQFKIIVPFKKFFLVASDF